VRSELTDWQTAVWAPKALLEAPVRAPWRTLGVMALLAFALVVALASWLGRIIARSVGHAARAAIALGEGGPMPLSGTPVDEVDTLMAELHKAAARRQAAEAWRHQSEAIFRAMFDVSSVGKIEVDPRTTVSSAPTPRCASSWDTARRNCSPGRCSTSRTRTTATAVASWATARPPES